MWKVAAYNGSTAILEDGLRANEVRPYDGGRITIKAGSTVTQKVHASGGATVTKPGAVVDGASLSSRPP